MLPCSAPHMFVTDQNEALKAKHEDYTYIVYEYRV